MKKWKDQEKAVAEQATAEKEASAKKATAEKEASAKKATAEKKADVVDKVRANHDADKVKAAEAEAGDHAAEHVVALGAQANLVVDQVDLITYHLPKLRSAPSWKKNPQNSSNNKPITISI